MKSIIIGFILINLALELSCYIEKRTFRERSKIACSKLFEFGFLINHSGRQCEYFKES